MEFIFAGGVLAGLFAVVIGIIVIIRNVVMNSRPGDDKSDDPK